MFFFFFFKQKTAYEMRISDWSSDVCSSDLRIKTRALRGWATYGTGQDAPWTFTVHGTLVDSANRNRDGATPLNRTDGQRVRIGGQATHRFALGDSNHRVTVAVENEFERFKASGMQRRTRETVRSEEHTSELQSLMRNSYAVFWLKKKKTH